MAGEGEGERPARAGQRERMRAEREDGQVWETEGERGCGRWRYVGESEREAGDGAERRDGGRWSRNGGELGFWAKRRERVGGRRRTGLGEEGSSMRVKWAGRPSFFFFNCNLYKYVKCN